VASILRAHGPAVRQGLPWPQRRLLDLLPFCRTPALGGHRAKCTACGHQEVHHNPCQDRHCPTCSGARAARWLDQRRDKLLPVPHFQVVFTLPQELRPLARAAPRQVYDLLISAAVDSLQAVLRTQYQARFAITAVLHTWTRELHLHPHVHVVVSAGGLSLDDDRWVPTTESFLTSTRKLAPLFRGKMLSGLRRARGTGKLDLVDPLASQWEPLLQAAADKTWVIHVEPPNKRSPGTLLKYLSRYLFRVAIDDRRVLAHDGQQVTIRTRGKATVTMAGETFVRRFVLHALPKGIRKVRYYGLLAPSNVRTRLVRAFELLGAGPPRAEHHEPAPDPTCDPLDDREPRRRCPSCGQRAIEMWRLPPDRGPPAAAVMQRRAS
jgi:hypothetical protein